MGLPDQRGPEKLLQSGLHSSHLIRFGNIGWERKLTKEVAAALLEIAPFAREATAVVCPETAGVFLGKALAEQDDGETVYLRFTTYRRAKTPIDADEEPIDAVKIASDAAQRRVRRTRDGPRRSSEDDFSARFGVRRPRR